MSRPQRVRKRPAEAEFYEEVGRAELGGLTSSKRRHCPSSFQTLHLLNSHLAVQGGEEHEGLGGAAFEASTVRLQRGVHRMQGTAFCLVRFAVGGALPAQREKYPPRCRRASCPCGPIRSPLPAS